MAVKRGRPASFLPVPEQMERIGMGAVEIVREEELAKKLDRSRRESVPIRIKVGFDPSTADIHLGHTVLLRKMRHFQDLGHEVIFLIGDFTGRIGDPTGMSRTRPQLGLEQIKENARTYRKQAMKVLDRKRIRVMQNSRWLSKLGADGFIDLASRYTVARMLERDDFSKRYSGRQSIGIHEFLYPLAQAYDSVHLRADVELGGTDQTFNLLMGREIMRSFGLEPQVVLTMPLLVGTDGVEKMSKSLGNFIGVEEPAREIFGKIMSISDDLMLRYYELCTNIQPSELADLRKNLANGRVHPKQTKENLAKILVTEFHGPRAAAAAAREFERIFVGKGKPDEVREFVLPRSREPIWLPGLLVRLDLASSRGEARRLVRQGGVYLDGRRIEDTEMQISASSPKEHLFRVGKRKFARLVIH